MVGTAVYQLGPNSAKREKKLSALKPSVQTTEPPACSDDSTAAISPWMWNSGMTLRQRSASPSASVAAMWPAEAVTLRCISGTILGRDVVPEVCSTSAISSGSGALSREAPRLASRAASSLLSGTRSNVPAGRMSSLPSARTGMRRLRATCVAGPSSPRATTSTAGLRSDR